MKKHIAIIFIVLFLVTALTLFAVQIINKSLNLNKQVKAVLILGTKQVNPNTKALQQINISSEEINKIEQYAKEFNIPAELKEELMKAVTKGTVDTQWGKTEITQKELDEAGLSLEKLAKQKSDSKTANISEGYIVSAAKFEKILAACKPAKDDSQQIKELKKQAQEELGFSALADDNKEQIEEIISQTESMEMPRVPMIDLEYALLLFDDGRKDEAYKIIDDSIFQNQGDKEFIEIAKALRENMNKYE